MVFLIFERLQHLDSKPPYKALRDSLEVVILNEFIKIDAQALKRNQEMLSEDAVVFDSDDVILVVFVMVV
tara:strand:+ start:283 stop:492 length:210 start_codon:yes stop_codon:yes gene_type:complete